MKKIPVFLDTNILLHSMELGINIERDLQSLINRSFIVYIHPLVEAEIINMLLEDGKLGQQANVAMKLMAYFDSYTDERKYFGADISLLRSAKRDGGLVLTLDKELRDRCIRDKVPVISSFKKGRLKLFGWID